MHKLSVMLIAMLCSVQVLADGFLVTGGQGEGAESLYSFDETTGTVGYIGTPEFLGGEIPENMGMSGLVITADGRLLVTTGNETNLLVEISPATGEVVTVIGEYTDGSFDIRDTAIDPVSQFIYAISYTGELHGMNPDNAATSSISPPEELYGAIAFGGDGTLYMVEMNPENDAALYTVNLGDGSLTWVSDLGYYYMGLGMGEDGMLYGSVFEGNGQFGQGSDSFGDIYQINAATGAETLISQNAGMVVHDIAFGAATAGTAGTSEPVPSLSQWALILLSMGLLLPVARRLRRV